MDVNTFMFIIGFITAAAVFFLGFIVGKISS